MKTRKLLSILIALVMVLCLFPVGSISSFADETAQNSEGITVTNGSYS